MEKLITCGKLVKITTSVEDTDIFGFALADILRREKLNIFLCGSLGAGKTTLLKGIGKGLEIREYIVSTTFQLVRKYNGAKVIILTHIDLYRLHNVSEILHLGWWELLQSDGITAVEWADRAESIWPEKGLFLKIKIISRNKRQFEIFKL